ncbi:MAG: site-specific DNA-methyltransferase [Phycisphaerae bacterium]|nr:site-specific DNA-methyltransferase [Phycisphaerae bacterium]
MKKLKMHTPDGTKDNIARIAELFPNCVTETKDEKGNVTRAIDFDQLRQELSDHVVDGPRERYHLDWPGKREALLAANAPIAKTLTPSRSESVHFESTRNLYIEGDNLDALKLLQETYLNRIKVIYIDPPYNTGNQLLYDDDFSDDSETYFRRSLQRDENGIRMVANTEANGRRHSDWLSSLLPRLKLARTLLASDGVIWASIDDNEVTNLCKLFDEVFGENNFLGLIPVVTNMKGRNDKEFQAQIHEYLVVYQKEAFASIGLEISDEKRSEYDQVTSDGRKFLWRDLRKRGGADTRRERPNLYYPIYVNPADRTVSLIKTKLHVLEVLPRKSDGEDGRWRWEKATLESRIGEVAGQPVRGKEEWNISYQVFLDNPESGERREKPKSVWFGKEYATDSGTKLLNSLFPGLDAKELAPKALGLMSRIIELSMDSGGTMLDFYSGSATTAHAIMQANLQDGQNRQFIMVQLPEPCAEDSQAFRAGFKTIAEIGKERIRRAGKVLAEKAGLNAGALDIGFRVLKVDTSNMKDVYYQPDALTQETLQGLVDNVKEGRSDEDLLFQVLLDWGVDLTLPITSERIKGKAVYFVDTNALAACFEPGIDEAFIKELAARKPLRAVFRDTGYGSDATKINVEQIFKLLSPGTEVKSI